MLAYHGPADLSGLAFLKAIAFEQKLADFISNVGDGLNVSGRYRRLCTKKKRASKRPSSKFFTPRRTGRLILLSKRYEEMDLRSTGKRKVLVLFLFKKKAAHEVRPVSTGRSSVPNPFGLFQNSYETAI